MNKTEFLDGMSILVGAYLEERLTNENTLNVWYQFFKEIDSNVFDKAIKEIVLESIKRPSISELNEKCKMVAKEFDRLQELEDKEKEKNNEELTDEEWEEMLDKLPHIDWGNL